MEIITKQTHDPKIEAVEIMGNLTSRDALEFQEYLFACLDNGNCCQLMDFKHVRKIDGLGINALSNFVNRGIQIRLFNVRTEIRSLIKLSGKDNIIKTFNETNRDKSVSLFAKEILEEKDTVKYRIKRRQHRRINTFCQEEFKYHCHLSGEVNCQAIILNISKGGIFVDQITAIDAKNRNVSSKLGIYGRELLDIKFKLDKSLEFIETNGKCIWEIQKNRKLSVGIRFTDMSKTYENMISDYVKKTI